MNENSVVYAGLSQTPLDPGQAETDVWAQTAGAVVAFSGIIRNHDAGQSVDRLNYTAHPSAEAALSKAAEETAAAHPGVRLWVSHRIGELHIGDHALVASCASPHRAEAFAACADLVENVKKSVPIWKEQFYSDGTKSWVGLP